MKHPKNADFGRKDAEKRGKIAEVWMFLTKWYTFNYYSGTLLDSIFLSMPKTAKKLQQTCKNLHFFAFPISKKNAQNRGKVAEKWGKVAGEGQQTFLVFLFNRLTIESGLPSICRTSIASFTDFDVISILLSVRCSSNFLSVFSRLMVAFDFLLLLT